MGTKFSGSLIMNESDYYINSYFPYAEHLKDLFFQWLSYVCVFDLEDPGVTLII